MRQFKKEGLPPRVTVTGRTPLWRISQSSNRPNPLALTETPSFALFTTVVLRISGSQPSETIIPLPLLFVILQRSTVGLLEDQMLMPDAPFPLTSVSSIWPFDP